MPFQFSVDRMKTTENEIKWKQQPFEFFAEYISTGFCDSIIDKTNDKNLNYLMRPNIIELLFLFDKLTCIAYLKWNRSVRLNSVSCYNKIFIELAYLIMLVNLDIRNDFANFV